MAADWHAHARDLARRLTGQGLRDPAWIEVFAHAPRHEFAPRATTLDYDGRVIDAVAWDRAELLRRSYADEVMVTRFETVSTAGDDVRIATSSASQPAIVAIMLQLLAVDDGHRILEIGTGPGYDACLLCMRVGDHHVTSMDIQSAVIAEAGENLARCGQHPHLVAGDGALGCPHRAPFDRIIATCALPAIPAAWPGQLAPGGRIVAPMTFGGALAVLDRDDRDEAAATGGFASDSGYFMTMRHLGQAKSAPAAPTAGTAHRTRMDPVELTDPAFRLWLELAVPGLAVLPSQTCDGRLVAVRFTRQDDTTLVECDSGRDPVVTEYGRPLWRDVETQLAAWHRTGRPGRDRFGYTVRPDRQWIWLDDPAGDVQWEFPPRAYLPVTEAP
jgi:protein-L-isoaspartate(D-aspartate) O-methyltransferase